MADYLNGTKMSLIIYLFAKLLHFLLLKVEVENYNNSINGTKISLKCL
jgi:hypothetical protein